MATVEQSDDFRASLKNTILDEAPDGILVVDQDNRIISVNRRFFLVWGLSLPACPLDDLQHISDAPIL